MAPGGIGFGDGLGNQAGDALATLVRGQIDQHAAQTALRSAGSAAGRGGGGHARLAHDVRRRPLRP